MELDDITKRRNYVKNVLYKSNSEDSKAIDKLAGFLISVSLQHQAILTDFLDPGQRNVLKILAGNDCFLQAFGGYHDAEKKRVYISEEWVNLGPINYSVSPCEIEYPEKFNRLSHSEILGSLTNCGVETSTFGDIITNGKGKWQFFVKTELLDFFKEEIKQVGRIQVRIRPIADNKILIPEDDACEMTIIAASLRLDAVLSEISNKSRREIKDAFSANLVKLNWHVIKDFNIIVKENDVLSLRYFGRCQILKIRTTRKGKYKVVLKLWQTKKRKQKKH